MFMLSMDGDVLQTFKGDSINETKVGNFVSSALSMRGKWLYGVTDKGYLLSFTAATGVFETSMQISNGDVYGVTHHPYRNMIATFSNDGYVRLWKA